jgi:pimeloyl-ACP methyl ester carboxylesterase
VHLLLISLLALADTSRTYPVRLAKAETLSVTEAGTGPAVVLIPGLFGAAYGFRHVTPRLRAHGYRVIVVEPLGIGSSSRPRRADYSQYAQAGRVLAVLDSLKVDGAIVVGHSAAASIAFRMALRRPAVVRAIVAIDAGALEDGAVGARPYAAFVPWIKWLGGVKLIRRKIRESLIQSSGDTTWITDQVIQNYTAGAAANLDGTLLAFLAMGAAKEPEKLRPRIPEIRVPVILLLAGAQHNAAPAPESIAFLGRSLPVFSVDTVPGSGHHVQEERPEAIVAAVRRLGKEVGFRESRTTP